MKIEILDAQNRLVRTLSSVPREPMGSERRRRSGGPQEAGAARRRRACSARCGTSRWDGARKIKGGKIDTGDPADGPRVAPGTYTVRLTVDGKTLTAPLKVVADPRGRSRRPTRSRRRPRSRCACATTCSKLTDLVNELRSVREQLKARDSALEPRKSEAGVADLIKASDAAIKRAAALEDKLHNPTAEVVYDILAMRGGARLYSRLRRCSSGRSKPPAHRRPA